MKRWGVLPAGWGLGAPLLGPPLSLRPPGIELPVDMWGRRVSWAPSLDSVVGPVPGVPRVAQADGDGKRTRCCGSEPTSGASCPVLGFTGRFGVNSIALAQPVPRAVLGWGAGRASEPPRGRWAASGPAEATSSWGDSLGRHRPRVLVWGGWAGEGQFVLFGEHLDSGDACSRPRVILGSSQVPLKIRRPACCCPRLRGLRWVGPRLSWPDLNSPPGRRPDTHLGLVF